jgi:hypothetical protein
MNIQGFKNAAEMKWYLYRSDAKLRILYPQIAHRDIGKKMIEWKASAGFVSVGRRVETDRTVDEDDMLRAVIEELEAEGQVGTVYEPNSYIKGVMPMRWGMYDDCGRRDPDQGPLVYFGGLDEQAGVLLGLGGSSKHVMGHEGATSTYSRSCTPALVTALLRGIESGLPQPPDTEDPRHGEDEVYRAMAIAQHYLRPPTQNLEFFANTLMVGETHACELYIGVPTVKVVLGTPLYVALIPPYPKDDHWGLIPD